MANSYGMLGYYDESMSIPIAKTENIAELFANSRTEDSLLLNLEDAGRWVLAWSQINRLLSQWPHVRDSSDPAILTNFFEEFNEPMVGSLTLQIRVDHSTGQVSSDVTASSLAHAISSQWASAVAANVGHRQCRECTTWFAVHAGSGRPDKLYCSDACRMRAYRRRKAD
jgi:hypothetical protein